MDTFLDSSFKERLEFLFGADVGPTKIAKKIGMAYAGFARVWYDGSIPKADTLLNIKEATGCSLDWLLTGEGSPYNGGLITEAGKKILAEEQSTHQVYDTLGNKVDVDEFVFLPRYAAKAAAGFGHLNTNERPIHTMAFRRYFIENVLFANPSDLFLIGAKGDSMPGVVDDRDVIMGNRAIKPGNGLFILRTGGELLVKHIETIPGNKLLVKSTNELYSTFELDLTKEYEDIEILGGVQWLGRVL